MPDPVRLNVITPDGPQTIQPNDAQRKLRITELLRFKSMPLNTRCGQRGLCDGCLVHLREGSLQHVSTGQTLQAGEQTEDIRSCEYTLGDAAGDVLLEIPHRSMLGHAAQVEIDFRINVPRAHEPLVQDPKTPLGVAIDIGTTTVAVLLVELATGEIMARASGFNKQMNLGDDVLTRINLCLQDPTMLEQLQQEVVAHTIEPLLIKALEEVGREPTEVGCITVAANTTMLHLLAGRDPSPMGQVPFTPVFTKHLELRAADVGFAALPHRHDVPLHLLPSGAAYVGADLIAGAFATGLAWDEGPTLLVDVGTNGEIILKTKDHLLGCATAAGPAFEGGGLRSGIRAGEGAISRIRIDGDPAEIHTTVIGDTKPIGLCGSAYIDFLAQASRAGLLTETGRFVRDKVDHLLLDPEADYLAIHFGHHGRKDKSVVVIETDVASLLQAKAAIAAGILTLLEHAGIAQRDVKQLYLAGGFGVHLDHGSAIHSGLLPGFTREQIQVVGNTSLAGALLCLLDRNVLDELTRIAQRIEVIELNTVPTFEMAFIEQLTLPQ